MPERRRQYGMVTTRIPECPVHVIASSVRFHSRDNRLKGDRRGRCTNERRLRRIPHLENKEC
jgi:hypothetical protein